MRFKIVIYYEKLWRTLKKEKINKTLGCQSNRNKLIYDDKTEPEALILY